MLYGGSAITRSTLEGGRAAIPLTQSPCVSDTEEGEMVQPAAGGPACRGSALATLVRDEASTDAEDAMPLLAVTDAVGGVGTSTAGSACACADGGGGASVGVGCDCS